MKRIILLTALAIGFCLLCGMSLFPGGNCYLRSFEGKVIDAETKEPIEGAAVLGVYYGVTDSIAGSNHYAIDAQETLTDANGEFKIPDKKIKSKDVTGKPDCNLIIFKPGYGVFPRHKLSDAVGENKSWPTPEKYIVYELPKLKTIEERKKNLLFQYYEGFGDKIFFNFLNLINEEYKSLGLPGITIPEKEK